MENINFYNPREGIVEALRQKLPDKSVILVTPPDSPYLQAFDLVGAQESSDIFERGNHVLLTFPSNTSERSLFARLLSHLRQILTRQNSVASYGSAYENDKEHIRVNDLLIIIPTHEVFRSGEHVKLTLSEFNLLVAMASRNGDILDYVSLVQTVLGYDTGEIEAKELIKRHIFTLRRKIEPTPGKPRYILNVRGVGYRMSMA